MLSLSPSHIEKYFQAAEKVLAEAYPPKPPEPVLVRKLGHQLRGGSRRQLDALEAAGRLDEVRVDMWPGHRIQGGRPGPGNNAFKVGGVFKVRVKASGLAPAGGRAPHLTFMADKLDRMLFEQDILAPEDAPVVVEFTTHLPPGGHSFVVCNDVPGPSTLPRSGRSGSKPFLSLAEGRIPWQLKLTDEEGRPLHPFLILDWIEWEGPIVTDRERQLRDGYLPAEDAEGGHERARAGLRRLAERAFRRALRPGELDRYVGLVEREMAAGEHLVSATKTAMLAILCSKDFLHIVEGDADRVRGVINDWELASRLSYFLWSTMPDDELFDLARAGTLHRREVLRAQFARMLADPKARRFSADFPRQWLQLQKLGMFPPDKKLYPDYDQWLERSMAAETTEFFAEALAGNLSLREFLLSDWTMVNPRLARHYGIPPPAADRFERVALRPEHHRGGILTHAAVLSLTSDGTRHRPVHRGVWVLESILGKSPPPPARQRGPHRAEPAGRAQGDDPHETGRAQPRPQLRRLPRQDRSARPRLRPLRRHRTLARGRAGSDRQGPGPGRRRQRHTARRPPVRRRGRIPAAAARGRGHLRAHLPPQARHLRPPPHGQRRRPTPPRGPRRAGPRRRLPPPRRPRGLRACPTGSKNGRNPT